MPRMAKMARAMSSDEVKRKPASVVRSRPGTTNERPSTTRLATAVAATRVVGPGGIQICSTAPTIMAPNTSSVVRRASRWPALSSASGARPVDLGVLLTMDLRESPGTASDVPRLPTPKLPESLDVPSGFPAPLPQDPRSRHPSAQSLHPPVTAGLGLSEGGTMAQPGAHRKRNGPSPAGLRCGRLALLRSTLSKTAPGPPPARKPGSCTKSGSPSGLDGRSRLESNSPVHFSAAGNSSRRGTRPWRPRPVPDGRGSFPRGSRKR